MQVLNQDIKEGAFKPVYLIYGEEEFLKNSYKNKLRTAIVGDDPMNFSRFEGKGLDIDELIRLADTMPFFAEQRLILVEDSGFFKSASEALVKYLPDMPKTQRLSPGRLPSWTGIPDSNSLPDIHTPLAFSQSE